MTFTCASAAVKMCSSGTGLSSSRYMGDENFACTPRAFFAPVLERKTYGLPLSCNQR